MKFSARFRYVWWFVLLVALGAIVIWRRSSVFGSEPTTVDFLFIALLLAMAAVPIFAEITVGAVTLKQKIEEAKQDLGERIEGVRQEMRVGLSVSNRITQEVYLGAATPPDEAIRRAEEKAARILEDTFAERDVGAPARVEPQISNLAQELILSRTALEREVRRLWEKWRPFADAISYPRRPGFGMMVSDLVNEGAITPELGAVLRELYSVSSAAVHGEDPTEAQHSFVAKVLPEVLAKLRSLERDG